MTQSPTLRFLINPVCVPVRSAMSPVARQRCSVKLQTASSKAKPCRVERAASSRRAVIWASVTLTSD